MTDISDMIRWNANFVRGLAQSVLERAKSIRNSVSAGIVGEQPTMIGKPVKSKRSPAAKKPVRKSTTVTARKPKKSRNKKTVHAH